MSRQRGHAVLLESAKTRMLLSLLFKVMAISLIHGVSSSGCGSRFQTRAGNQPKPEPHLLLPFCLDTEKLIGLASLLSSPRPPLSRTSACLKSKTMIEMLPAILPPPLLEYPHHQSPTSSLPFLPLQGPKMEMALSQLRRQVPYCHHSPLPGLLALLLHHSHLSRHQAQPQF